MKKEVLNSKLFRMYRWLFRKCDYCGNKIKNGGGKVFNGGTPHYVYPSLPNGFPSDKQIVQYACLKCEMEFDEE